MNVIPGCFQVTTCSTRCLIGSIILATMVNTGAKALLVAILGGGNSAVLSVGRWRFALSSAPFGSGAWEARRDSKLRFCRHGEHRTVGGAQNSLGGAAAQGVQEIPMTLRCHNDQVG